MHPCTARACLLLAVTVTATQPKDSPDAPTEPNDHEAHHHEAQKTVSFRNLDYNAPTPVLIKQWVDAGALWFPSFVDEFEMTDVEVKWMSEWATNVTVSDLTCDPREGEEGHCRCWKYDVLDLDHIMLYTHPDECAVHARNHGVVAISPDDECYDIMYEDEEILWGECSDQCPMPRALDFRAQCFDHTFHPFVSTYRGLLLKGGSMYWVFLFCSSALLIGSLFRLYFPSWLPYTVGLLVFSLVIGLIAQAAVQENDCPSRAVLYAGHDHMVDRLEWDNFVGAGAVKTSMCMKEGRNLIATVTSPLLARWRFNSDLAEAGGDPTCGDGAPDKPSQCRWGFDDLYKPWKHTKMYAESVWHMRGEETELEEQIRKHKPGRQSPLASNGSSTHAAHGRRGRRASSSEGGTGPVLTADELWTFECNWLRDVIGTVDMDPHLFLMVFLPPLLFESAAFGVDMGIFRKQLAQILLMAFFAMAVA